MPFRFSDNEDEKNFKLLSSKEFNKDNRFEHNQINKYKCLKCSNIFEKSLRLPDLGNTTYIFCPECREKKEKIDKYWREIKEQQEQEEKENSVLKISFKGSYDSRPFEGVFRIPPGYFFGTFNNTR